MTSNFRNRLCSRVSLLGLVAFLGGLPAAVAQSNGPDPFQPYTAQYNPYTYPMGPASPEAGQSGARGSRSGLRGANQFQDFMEEVGGDRGRSGIGSPYYRSSVDPAFDAANRSYRPNQKADLSFEESQKIVTQKYLAYLSERDPRRRAELLKEYRRSQRTASRALNLRPETPSRLLESATRRTVGSAESADDGTTASRTRTPGTPSSRAGLGRLNAEKPASGIGPPPPLSAVRRGLRSNPRAELSPSEVLERARQRELGTGRLDDTTLDVDDRPAARRRPSAPPVVSPEP